MRKSFTTSKGTELPILSLRGKEYLEVKYRIVWFREERPAWSIETEFTSLSDRTACAKATIRDEQGRIVSTSHKIEDKQGFHDFAEKAETGSIGRALALLGYGTQFCGDELDEGDRIVDSPVGQDRGVYPEQPEHGNGFHIDKGYRIDFGKWNKKSLEQVYSNEGPEEIANYIDYLEKAAQKKGVPIQGKVATFIKEAEEFLGAMENGGENA